jgi:hypothetical protein
MLCGEMQLWPVKRCDISSTYGLLSPYGSLLLLANDVDQEA